MHWIALQPRPGEPADLGAWTLQALRFTPGWRMWSSPGAEVGSNLRLFGGLGPQTSFLSKMIY